jgi:hypothetical protein
MRRPKLWWIVLALLALPPLIFAWAHLAAVATIDRLESEMDAEIARLRSEGHPRPPLFEDPLPGDALDDYRRVWTRIQGLTPDQRAAVDQIEFIDPLKELPAGVRSLEDLRSAARDCARDVDLGLRRSEFRRLREYELGMAAPHGDRVYELCVLFRGGAEAERRAGNPNVALRHLTAHLGLYADAMRGVDVYGFPVTVFGPPFRTWQAVLAGSRLPPAELERALRALDRIEAALPTAFDALRHQHNLERIDLVLAYRGRQSNWASAAEPSWKHAGSRALKTCEMLRALERQRADLDELALLPLRERVAAGRTHDREYFDGPQIGRGRLWMGIQESLWRDVVIRLHLRLMRAATAVAWHEAETGRLPASLEELVPRRLPEVPTCPLSGAPFRYADGRLWAFGFDRDDDGGRPVPQADYEGDGDVLWTLKKP